MLNGAVRPGDNLFNNSIVALDVETGEHVWLFQQIHHDIWDYDSPNPIVLFEAEFNGERRRGLVQVRKAGWAYILDRTGEPLIGIEERPVPQEPRQLTSPTQPYPIGDAIVPQEVDVVPFDATSPQPDGTIPNRGRIFTPFWTERIMVKPAPQGGANWPPSSFDPATNTLSVCATDRLGSYAVSPPLEPPVDNVPYFGGSLGQSSAPGRGIFAALDVTTNRIVWRQQWTEPVTPGSGLGAFGGGPGGAAASEPNRPADADNGELIYREACLACHSARGDGGEGGGASLLNALTIEAAAAVSAAGRNDMPAFRGAYSTDELYDVATFIVEHLAVD